jgi:hypothetical protein
MTQSSWDLYWIAVIRRSGTGVGRLLLAKSSRARASSCTHLWVETAGRDNYKPTRFFIWRPVTRSPANYDFYAPGDSMIVFVKAL